MYGKTLIMEIVKLPGSSSEFIMIGFMQCTGYCCSMSYVLKKIVIVKCCRIFLILCVLNGVIEVNISRNAKGKSSFFLQNENIV